MHRARSLTTDRNSLSERWQKRRLQMRSPVCCRWGWGIKKVTTASCDCRS